MGVCIETISQLNKNISIASHPVWVCVLKLDTSSAGSSSYYSHTLYGCVY